MAAGCEKPAAGRNVGLQRPTHPVRAVPQAVSFGLGVAGRFLLFIGIPASILLPRVIWFVRAARARARKARFGIFWSLVGSRVGNEPPLRIGE